ncbi:PAS domain S-box protein [Flectobacillus major]|uniref:PAS domain S-box protein n=1 Tax=Flectobacillus major TaxID=103 RepID=UPI00040B6251|nr:PAS domain S-box protein [Flectobacillus major]
MTNHFYRQQLSILNYEYVEFNKNLIIEDRSSFFQINAWKNKEDYKNLHELIEDYRGINFDEINSEIASKSCIHIPESVYILTGRVHEIYLHKFEENYALFVKDLGMRSPHNEELQFSDKLTISDCKQLFQQAPVAMLVSNLESNNLFFNDQFINFFGYNSDDISSVTDWLNCAFPSDTDRNFADLNWYENIYPTLNKEHIVQPFECQITCKNKEIKICEVSFMLAMNTCIITFLDVTERIKIQNSYLESLQNFREISDNVNDILWIRDENDDKLLYSNKKFKDIFEDINNHESKLLHISQYIYPDDIPPLKEAQENYLKTSYIPFNQTFRVKVQKNERWFNLKKFPLHDQAGNVYRHVGLAKDITIQIQFAEKQKRNELFQTTIIELSNKFMNYPFSNNDGVDLILETIGNYVGCLQVLLYEIDNTQLHYREVNAWTSSTVIEKHTNLTILDTFKVSDIEHLIPKALEEDLLFVEDIETLNFNTELIKSLQLLEIENILILPIKKDTSLVGFLSMLSDKKKKVYETDEIALLRLTKDLIQNVKVRHQMEYQLRTSEQEYHNIFESMTDGVVYLNKNAEILKANQSAFKFFGLENKGIKYWTELVLNVNIVDETFQLLDFNQLPIIQAVVKKQEIREKVVGLQNKESSEIRWMSISTQIEYLTDDKDDYRVFATLTDISERKEFIDTLSESEYKYRRLTENLQDVIYRYELLPERKFSYISPSVTVITGYTPKEYYDDPNLGLKIVHEDDKSIIQSLINGNINLQSPVTVRWKRKDGRIIWVEQRNVPVRDSEGNLIAIEGIRRDVTEIKVMIDKLNFSNKLQEMLMHIFLTFINISLDTVEEKIKESLAKVGEFMRAECLFVVYYDTKNGTYRKQYHWRKGDRPLDSYNIGENGNISEIESYFQKHQIGDSYFTNYNNVNIFTVPIYAEESCIGFVGLTFLNTTNRTKDFDFQILTLIGEMLKNIKHRQFDLDTIKEGQLLLESIIENSGSVIYVKDLEGRYINVNKNWELLTGLKKEESLGRTVFDFFPHETAKKFSELDKLVIDEQKTLSVQDIVTQGENHKLFLTVKFPIRDANNLIVGIGGQSTEITHLKLTEKALKDSEANLKAILDSSSESIWSINKDYEIIYANEIVYRDFLYSFGYRLEKGTNILDCLPESLKNLWRDRYYQVLQNKVLHFNDTVPTIDKIFYLEISMNPIIVNGEVVGVAVFSKNITKEKFAQNEISKFSYIFENLLNEIFIFDANTLKFIDVNQAAQANIGYTLEELRKLTPIDLKPLISHEQFLSLIEPLKNHQKDKLIFETIHLRKNRTKYDVEVHLQYIEIDGSPIFIAIIVDITERKNTERALLESENRFRSIFQDSASIMYLINPDNGQFIDANEACVQFYGWGKDDFLKLNILDVNISHDDLTRKFEVLSRLERQKFEVQHRTSTGQIFDMEVYCCMLNVGGQNLIFEIAHNITERNKYFKAVEIQNKSLKEIAWIQSHVVRAPLSRLMGLAMLIQDGFDNPRELNKCLEHIVSSAFEIDQIIKDITQKTYIIQDMERNTTPNFNTISTKIHFSIVDDDSAIQLLHKLLLKKAEITPSPNQFLNGKGIVEYISENNHSEDIHIIFLDLNMPELDGWGVLEYITHNNLSCKIYVIIVSSSIDESDKLRAQIYPCVIDFIQKPISINKLFEIKSSSLLKVYFEG